ncbi:MAG: hypothetical protein D6737_10060, partial [Chloroflexi bacterium]
QEMPVGAAQIASDSEQSEFPTALKALTVVTVIAVVMGLYMALVNAGTDTVQGDVQRIFYIHVPAFFAAFVAFSATVVGGVQYLRKREKRWDTLALAGAEVGLVLAIVNIVTGAIWARPIWNTWWTWDPRLTSATIMALTYAAYLMLRNGVENQEQRYRFAAVYGILAFTTVIATIVIIRIRPDTIHPAVVGPSQANARGAFELDATRGVAAAIGFNMVVWMTLVPITLMWYRVRLENMFERVNAMKVDLLSREG